MRTSSNHVNIVPRYAFRIHQDQTALVEMFKNPDEHYTLAHMLTRHADAHGFDGVLLETGSPLFFERTISHVHDLLHPTGKQFILVVHPEKPGAPGLNPTVFRRFLDKVDFVTIMTYDFTRPSE